MGIQSFFGAAVGRLRSRQSYPDGPSESRHLLLMAREELGAVLGVRKFVVDRVVDDPGFPAPVGCGSGNPRWRSADVAAYAVKCGFRYSRYLPGFASSDNASRWPDWRGRVMLADIPDLRGFGSQKTFSVAVDIYSSRTGGDTFPGVSTSAALAWVTPIWPAETSQVILSNAEDIVSEVSKIVGNDFRLGIEGQPVTLVFAETLSSSSRHSSYLVAVDAVAGTPIDPRDWFLSRIDASDVFMLLGQKVPAWPRGTNLFKEVERHVWGQPQTVECPGTFEKYRLLIDFAIKIYRKNGDDNFVALAKLLDQARHFDTPVGSLGNDLYLAAIPSPAPLPPGLPNGGSAFAAIDSILSSNTVPIIVADAVTAVLGDTQYSSPAVFKLKHLENRHSTSIMQLVEGAEHVEVNTPRLKRLVNELLVHDPGATVTLVRVASTTPDMPAFVAATDRWVAWVAPAPMGSIIGIPLCDLADVSSYVFLSTPSVNGNTRPAGWVFLRNGEALPLPLRDSPLSLGDELFYRATTQNSWTGYHRLPPELQVLERHMDVVGRQVEVTGPELTRVMETMSELHSSTNTEVRTGTS